MEPSFTGLLSLPREIQKHAFAYLDALDVINLSMTCKTLFKVSFNEDTWKSLCMDKWKDLEEITTKWRSYYYERTAFLSPKTSLTWVCKGVANNSVPSNRQSLTGNYVKGKVVYIGGQTSITQRFEDIYLFDPDKKIFTKPKVVGNVPKFARHAAAEVGNKIFIFGGFDGQSTFYELAVFDIDALTWTYPKVHGKPPVSRTNHAVTAIGNKLFLFGGNDTMKGEQNSTYKYGTYGDFQMLDTETMTWSEPITSGKRPCPRSGHHMVAIENKVFLFGGGLWNDKSKAWIEKYNDMYIFDLDKMEWKQVTQHNALTQAFISLPHWKVGHFIFVYHDPLWCFDILTNTWHQLRTKGSKPQKRFLGPATPVPGKHCAYLFGGVYSSILNQFDQFNYPSSILDILKEEKKLEREERKSSQSSLPLS